MKSLYVVIALCLQFLLLVVDSVVLNQTEYLYGTANEMWSTRVHNGAVYVAGEFTGNSQIEDRGRLMRINLSPFKHVSTLRYPVNGPNGTTEIFADGNLLYLVATPRMLKVNIDEMKIVGTVNSEDAYSCGCLVSSTTAFIGGTVIKKVSTGTMTSEDIALPGGISRVVSCAYLDNYVYFSTTNAHIIRINIHDDSLTSLNIQSGSFTGSVVEIQIRNSNAMLYAIIESSVAPTIRIQPVRLDTFALQGSSVDTPFLDRSPWTSSSLHQASGLFFFTYMGRAYAFDTVGGLSEKNSVNLQHVVASQSISATTIFMVGQNRNLYEVAFDTTAGISTFSIRTFLDDNLLTDGIITATDAFAISGTRILKIDKDTKQRIDYSNPSFAENEPYSSMFFSDCSIYVTTSTTPSKILEFNTQGLTHENTFSLSVGSIASSISIDDESFHITNQGILVQTNLTRREEIATFSLGFTNPNRISARNKLNMYITYSDRFAIIENFAIKSQITLPSQSTTHILFSNHAFIGLENGNIQKIDLSNFHEETVHIGNAIVDFAIDSKLSYLYAITETSFSTLRPQTFELLQNFSMNGLSTLLVNTENHEVLAMTYSESDPGQIIVFKHQCLPGSIVVDDYCQLCPQGSYSEGINSNSCTNCSMGSFSEQIAGTSSKACIGCPLGTWGENDGSTSQSDCKPCPEGTSTLEIGSTFEQCQPCPSGMYLDNLICSECPDGTFSSTSGGIGIDSCQLCPIGTEGRGPAQNSSDLCIPCASGSFGPEPGLGNCLPCGVGFYSEVKQSTTQDNCLACNNGLYTENPIAGSSDECVPCPPGSYYQKIGTLVQCTLCPAGTFRDLPGALDVSSCLKCPRGTYSNSQGQNTTCSPCPHGFITPSTGSTSENQCTVVLTCQPGRYKGLLNGIPGCYECAAGSYSTNGETCIPCPRGTYQNSKGKSSCIICPKGSFGPDLGGNSLQSCIPCGAGYIGFAEGSIISDCQICPNGTYNSLQRGEECLPCGERTVSLSQGNHICTPCPSGTFRSPERQFCVDCGANTFCPFGSAKQSSSIFVGVSPKDAIAKPSLSQISNPLIEPTSFIVPYFHYGVIGLILLSSILFSLVCLVCGCLILILGRSKSTIMQNFIRYWKYLDWLHGTKKDYTPLQHLIGALLTSMFILVTINLVLMNTFEYLNGNYEFKESTVISSPGKMPTGNFRLEVAYVTNGNHCNGTEDIEGWIQGENDTVISNTVWTSVDDICRAVWECENCSLDQSLTSKVRLTMNHPDATAFAFDYTVQTPFLKGKHYSITGSRLFCGTPTNPETQCRGEKPTMIQLSLNHIHYINLWNNYAPFLSFSESRNHDGFSVQLREAEIGSIVNNVQEFSLVENRVGVEFSFHLADQQIEMTEVVRVTVIGFFSQNIALALGMYCLCKVLAFVIASCCLRICITKEKARIPKLRIKESSRTHPTTEDIITASTDSSRSHVHQLPETISPKSPSKRIQNQKRQQIHHDEIFHDDEDVMSQNKRYEAEEEMSDDDTSEEMVLASATQRFLASGIPMSPQSLNLQRSATMPPQPAMSEYKSENTEETLPIGTIDPRILKSGNPKTKIPPLQLGKD